MMTQTHPFPTRYTIAVETHQHLVYAAALRQLRDPASADDATQAVFLILLKKLPTLPDSRPLAPWLLTVTRYVCNDTRKRDRRRLLHEQRSAMESPMLTTTEPHFHQYLDDALATLSKKERDILTLRFLQQLEIPSVAASLHLTEANARKRIARALTSLRNYFTRHQINLSATAATSLLTHAATIHAPAHLTATLATLTTKTASTGTLALSHATAKKLLLATLRLPAATAAILALAASITVLATNHPIAPVPPTSTATTNPVPHPIASLSKQDILNAIQKRRSQISTIDVEYSYNAIRARDDAPNYYAFYRIILKGSKSYIDRTWTSNEPQARHFREVTAYNGQHSSVYNPTSESGLALAVVSNGYDVHRNSPRDHGFFDINLWDPPVQNGNGLNDDNLESFLKSKYTSVRANLESIDGHDCYVVDDKPRNVVTWTAWLDPQRGFAPIREIFFRGPNQTPLIEAKAIEVTKVWNDVWLITDSTREVLSKGDESLFRMKVTRTKVDSLNLRVNAEIPDEVFALWQNVPAGTLVGDQDLPHTYSAQGSTLKEMPDLTDDHAQAIASAQTTNTSPPIPTQSPTPPNPLAASTHEDQLLPRPAITISLFALLSTIALILWRMTRRTRNQTKRPR